MCPLWRAWMSAASNRALNCGYWRPQLRNASRRQADDISNVQCRTGSQWADVLPSAVFRGEDNQTLFRFLRGPTCRM